MLRMEDVVDHTRIMNWRIVELIIFKIHLFERK